MLLFHFLIFLIVVFLVCRPHVRTVLGKVFRVVRPLFHMSQGTVIYFGEEMKGSVTMRGDVVLVDGRPLISYSAPVSEDSEFRLDEETQKAVEESLHLLDPRLPFEDNAKRVETYLKERGLTVRRAEFYGDVLLETEEGWGVVVLFNEEARMETAPELPPPPIVEVEGLVVVDKGFISLFPREAAETLLKNLEDIYASKEDDSEKIRKIRNLLKIPEESARKLLFTH